MINPSDFVAYFLFDKNPSLTSEVKSKQIGSDYYRMVRVKDSRKKIILIYKNGTVVFDSRKEKINARKYWKNL